MNPSTLFPRVFVRLLPAAGWATSLLVSTASAQVKPPEATDTDGNSYRYPVRTIEAPVRRTPGSDPRASDSNLRISGGDLVAIQRKLTTIILPRLEFHDTSLPDAIESIRQESRRLDADPDSENRGINIFLKLPKDVAVSSAHVTAELTDVPILEALESVAKLAGLKVKIEPYAVSLVPLSENTEPMFTVAYRVLPTALGLPSDPSPAPSTDAAATDKPPRFPNLKPWLENKGITFPPGTSATYLFDKHTLIMRNTQENLDRINALISQSPKDP